MKQKYLNILLCLFLYIGCESDPIPSTPVSVENIEATSIGYTSAIIKFSISGNANKAGVTYGADKEFSSATIQYSDKASGSISISLENLNQGMEYFYSVFAEDKRGNKISSETKNFITKSSSITTGDAMDVTTESAKLTMSFKGADINEAGIVYTTDALCKENLVTVSKADPTDSSLEFTINELNAGTTYYYKAFIKYNNGTIQYGEIKSFQTVEQFLKVSTTTIEAAAEGGTYQFEIEAKNVEWNILCEADWCTIEPTSGTGNATITVIVKENPALNLRSTNIQINKNIQISLIQQENNYKEYSILLSTLVASVCSDGYDDCYFAVQSDRDWYASSDQSWCIINTPSGYQNGYVSYKVMPNTTNSCRIATITVKNAVETHKFLVLQDMYDKYSRRNMVSTFNYFAQRVGFSIEGLTTWTASSDQDWCHIQNKEGNGNANIIVDLDVNNTSEDRFVMLTIESGMQKYYHIYGQLCKEKEKTINIPNIEMVKVEGGSFQMGDSRYEEAKPIHKVTLSSFYISKYLVTRELYASIMGKNNMFFANIRERGDKLPATIAWNDIQEFIAKLNSRTGKKYRLPTEAEWEYAARGGNKSKGYKYSGSNIFEEVGWCSYVYDCTPLMFVGYKKPNELGIYDMTGNVSEYCSDWYEEYTSNDQYNPQGPESGTKKVMRNIGYFPYTRRSGINIENSSGGPGFRLVLDE